MEAVGIIIFSLLICGMIYSLYQIHLLDKELKRNDWVFKARMDLIERGLDEGMTDEEYEAQLIKNLDDTQRLQSYEWMMKNNHITDIEDCFKD